MKPNNDPLYVDRWSNHPPSIIAINKRISTLSSDESYFNSTKHFHQNALSRSNYNVTFQYSNDNTSNIPTWNRKNRKIIWFNPPYSKNVMTNIARNFLHLIDKHFPKSSGLHKIFNSNTVKVSYSCLMPRPSFPTIIVTYWRKGTNHLLTKTVIAVQEMNVLLMENAWQKALFIKLRLLRLTLKRRRNILVWQRAHLRSVLQTTRNFSTTFGIPL